MDPKEHFSETPNNSQWADFSSFVRPSSDEVTGDALSATEDVLRALGHLQKAIDWQKSRIERLQQRADDFFTLTESAGEELHIKVQPGKLIFYGSADNKEKLISLLEETLQKLKAS